MCNPLIIFLFISRWVYHFLLTHNSLWNKKLLLSINQPFTLNLIFPLLTLNGVLIFVCSLLTKQDLITNRFGTVFVYSSKGKHRCWIINLSKRSQSVFIGTAVHHWFFIHNSYRKSQVCCQYGWYCCCIRLCIFIHHPSLNSKI